MDKKTIREAAMVYVEAYNAVLESGYSEQMAASAAVIIAYNFMSILSNQSQNAGLYSKFIMNFKHGGDKREGGDGDES